mmetsp:Transcript_24676/g.66512  ORF Transcript_24676/g.66512 Transcript_24676/m.66512 type:complete len:238 (+) Transcript_24676:1064-1777(+)
MTLDLIQFRVPLLVPRAELVDRADDGLKVGLGQRKAHQRLLRHDARRALLLRQQRHLAEVVAGLERRHHRVIRIRAQHHLGGSPADDIKFVPHVALTDDLVARRKFLLLEPLNHLLELILVQGAQHGDARDNVHVRILAHNVKGTPEQLIEVLAGHRVESGRLRRRDSRRTRSVVQERQLTEAGATSQVNSIQVAVLLSYLHLTITHDVKKVDVLVVTLGDDLFARRDMQLVHRVRQ